VTRRLGGLATCLVAIASISFLVPAPAGAVSAANQRLAEAYSPVVMLRQQLDQLCDTKVEQYKPPTTVDTVLGNPAVTLEREVNGGIKPVKKAPTAADIAGLGEDYYLDFPGDPLGDTCEYARDFAKLKAEGRAPAVTYAHIAMEPGHSGLAVQYWFFYYFNQLNDLHEGDWEGMQVVFDDASTAAEALAQGPTRIALFQHAGGERADWDDAKVQKDGDHPVVYSGAGGHATYYDNAIYISNGSHGSGVGCEDTSDPLIRTDPRPVLLPTTPAPGSQSQWLSYLGHWGQKAPGPFNTGPQGPATKRVWLEPFSWMDGIRQESPRLPGGAVLGPAASTAFCGAITGISEFINLKSETTIGAIGLILGGILLIVIPALLTRWRPVDISTPLRREWAIGQLLRGARQLYGRHWRTILAIAGAGFVILAAIQGVQYLFVAGNGDIEVHPFGQTLRFTGSFDYIANPIGDALVSGAVVAFVRLREEAKDSGFVQCYRALLPRFWRVVGAQLLVDVLLILLLITFIGLPFAAYFYIAWQFVQQEVIFEDRSIRESLRGSRAVVRGHWWRTLAVTGILALIRIVTGPVLGLFLIFLNLSALQVNLIGSVVFALLLPYVALGRTLLYLDLQARGEAAEELAGEPKRRPWLRWPRAAASESN
jgi:hypothetical protein